MILEAFALWPLILWPIPCYDFIFIHKKIETKKLELRLPTMKKPAIKSSLASKRDQSSSYETLFDFHKKRKRTNEKQKNRFSHSQWRQTFCARWEIIIYSVQSGHVLLSMESYETRRFFLKERDLFDGLYKMYRKLKLHFVHVYTYAERLIQWNSSFLSETHHHHKASFQVYHWPRRHNDRPLLTYFCDLI